MPNPPPTSDTPELSKASQLRETLTKLIKIETAGSVWTKGAFTDASILALAESHCPQEIQTIKSRLNSLNSLDILERIPVLGVCGTMNSGKSSLVASFLSEKGARRPLIGNLDPSQSTNRFTFWLPLGWKEDESVSAKVIEFAESIFGATPEFLSEDPTEAAAQQNARDSKSKKDDLGIPLLAFDPGLDEHGIAFLDCPDVQKSVDDSTLAPTAILRLEALQKGSRLCSGFVVVTTPDQAESEVLGGIFHALKTTGRDLPVFLALNKLHPSGKLDDVLGPIEEILNRWKETSRVQGIFGARYLFSEDKASPRPEFKSLPDEKQPLTSITRNLDPSALFLKAVASTISELSGSVSSVRNQLKSRIKAQDSVIKEVHQSVSSFLSDQLLDDEGGLRSFMTPALASQVMKSFKRTSPLWLRPGFMMHKPVDLLLHGVKNGLDWIKSNLPANWLVSRLLSRGLSDPDALKKIQPNAFVDHLKVFTFIPSGTKETQLSAIWTTSLEAISKHHLSKVVLDREELDDLTKRVWKHVPLSKKAAIALTFPLSLAAALLAVLFIPFDGGFTVVMAASVPELLAAAGLSYLANVPAMTQLKSLLEKNAGIPQVSDLHASLCDGLGVPRQKSPSLEHRATGRTIELLEANVTHQSIRIPCLQGGYCRLDGKAFTRIQNELEKLQHNQG